MNPYTDLRNDLAKSRDKWLESSEGKLCCEGSANGQYLENRLVRAYLAGYEAGQIAAAKKSIDICYRSWLEEAKEHEELAIGSALSASESIREEFFSSQSALAAPQTLTEKSEKARI